MFKISPNSIIIFIIISILLILFLGVFVIVVIYRYQQRQNTYFKEVEIIKTSYENTLLQSQLEIQEQTFQNISREIHDSIGQKLTLAKLHLNTLNYIDITVTKQQAADAITMISEAINDLTDISRSMSSEIILSNGLIKALEFEAAQLQKSGLYTIAVSATGNPIFMNANTELVLFRIVQEALNNIIKHAEATTIKLHLHYNTVLLTLEIADNGKGFNSEFVKMGTGLHNMKKRIALLNGQLYLVSAVGNGTTIKIQLPLNENHYAI